MPKNNKKQIKMKLSANKISRALAKMSTGGASKARASRARVMTKSQPAAFGPVSTIDTAPVAIGNSVRGASISCRNTKNGVTVTGRDFMFTAKGSGSITTWCTVGGTPITAACFTDSAIRNYMQLYQKFRVKKIIAHYITSSATSSTGDVLFYFQKNANSVYLNQTSSQLLPFVMSDPNTVLGPQWTNHSTSLDLLPTWKSTDYGMSSDLNQYSFGNLFLLSKTSTTDSPGYVIFDYEIEFAELQVSPRLLTLPIGRIQWYNSSFGLANQTTTANSTAVPGLQLRGNDISGSAATTPSGWTAGDVYKLVIDSTNSTYTNCTAANLFDLKTPNSNYVAFTIVDGTTFYAVVDGGGSSTIALYTTAEEAFALNAGSLLYGVTAAGNLTFALQCWISYVGSVNTNNTNPNF